MKFSRSLLAAAAGLALAAVAFPASAISYTLDTSDPDAGLAAGPYGTVTLTQSGSNVDFNVMLATGYNFVTTGGPHDLFAFNATDVALADIVGIVVAGGGTVTPHSPGRDRPFGGFTFGLDCTTCANGAPGQQADPLTFTVNNATISDFQLLSTRGSPSAYFGADVIFSSTGNTGAVGAVGGPVPSIPEPETYALMMAGLGAMGFVARRRRT